MEYWVFKGYYLFYTLASNLILRYTQYCCNLSEPQARTHFSTIPFGAMHLMVMHPFKSKTGCVRTKENIPSMFFSTLCD